MKNFTGKIAIFLAAFMVALVGSSLVFAKPAAGGYELFGDAALVSPGLNSPTAAQLRSGPTGAGFGGIDFAVPSGMTFADLQKLSTDYKFTAGTCGLGSPRFQVNVIDPNTNTTKNIFVYIGPPPSYTGCPQNVWQNTGDLAEPGNFVDASQVGGAFYTDYALAQTLYGSYQVTGIQLVIDAGFSQPGGEQTVVVDNVMINNNTYTFETGDSCKKGGWQQFTATPGPFKNQGQCVSYFANGGK